MNLTPPELMTEVKATIPEGTTHRLTGIIKVISGDWELTLHAGACFRSYTKGRLITFTVLTRVVDPHQNALSHISFSLHDRDPRLQYIIPVQ